MAYIGVSYSSYLYDVRVYDNCVEKTERILHEHEFHEKVISVLRDDLNMNSVSIKELNDLLVDPAHVSVCGSEPDFPT